MEGLPPKAIGPSWRASVLGSMPCLYPLIFQGTFGDFRRSFISSQPTMPSFFSNATINTHRNSVRSDRPPTYTSNATAAPTYAPNEQGSSSARYRSERVRARSGSIHGALSEGSQDSDTVFDQPESSLSDTVSITETSAEMTRPPGPRYSELSPSPYRNTPNVIKFVQFIIERMQRMGQFQRKTLSTLMTSIWDAFRPDSSHLLTMA
jgi:hypothetical protein